MSHRLAFTISLIAVFIAINQEVFFQDISICDIFTRPWIRWFHANNGQWEKIVLDEFSDKIKTEQPKTYIFVMDESRSIVEKGSKPDWYDDTKIYIDSLIGNIRVRKQAEMAVSLVNKLFPKIPKGKGNVPNFKMAIAKLIYFLLKIENTRDNFCILTLGNKTYRHFPGANGYIPPNERSESSKYLLKSVETTHDTIWQAISSLEELKQRSDSTNFSDLFDGIIIEAGLSIWLPNKPPRYVLVILSDLKHHILLDKYISASDLTEAEILKLVGTDRNNLIDKIMGIADRDLDLDVLFLADSIDIMHKDKYEISIWGYLFESFKPSRRVRFAKIKDPRSNKLFFVDVGSNKKIDIYFQNKNEIVDSLVIPIEIKGKFRVSLDSEEPYVKNPDVPLYLQVFDSANTPKRRFEVKRKLRFGKDFVLDLDLNIGDKLKLWYHGSELEYKPLPQIRFEFPESYRKYYRYNLRFIKTMNISRQVYFLIIIIIIMCWPIIPWLYKLIRRNA